jgi:putative membrane protein
MNQYFIIFLKGVAMGIAEVIPGVSGGTIAFITGIYERLLDAMKSFTPSLIGVFKKSGIKGVWEKIDGAFLLALFGGMFLSLISLVHLITWLLETFPVLLWSFFFGLIVASAVFIAKELGKWNVINIISLVIGTVLAYAVTVLSPASPNEALWFVFVSGVIAISAMILPGLSGSFVLVLMGMYSYIFGALKDLNFVVIIVFGLGCIIGILSFSHVLSWTFKHYKEITLAFLTGLMIGSLNKVWPWRNVVETRINSHGEEVPFRELSVLPSDFIGGEPYVLGAIALMIFGFLVVYLLEKFSK